MWPTLTLNLLTNNTYVPYIPAYSATPCIIRVKIWDLWWREKRLPLCIIRPQILDVGSVTGHLNVRHGYYCIQLNDAVTQDRYLHTRCSMTGTAATLQLCKTKGQYLLTCRVSKCVFLFSTAEWISSGLGLGKTFWGQHKLHIHTDFKIFIFRRQIYIILIYLLQRPYFNIVVLK